MGVEKYLKLKYTNIYMFEEMYLVSLNYQTSRGEVFKNLDKIELPAQGYVFIELSQVNKVKLAPKIVQEFFKEKILLWLEN